MKHTKGKIVSSIYSLIVAFALCGLVNPKLGLAHEGSIEESENAHPKDLVQTATDAGQFTILTKAIQVAGLEKTLKGEGPFTILAPTDEAFRKVPADQLDALMQKPDLLKKVLLNHVIEGKWSVEDLKDEQSIPTLEGSELKIIASENGKIKVNDAAITKSDIAARNGIIQVIDTVLVP
jgi:uncharacterized surface protein with fasciclin (FAS1) repeats